MLSGAPGERAWGSPRALRPAAASGRAPHSTARRRCSAFAPARNCAVINRLVSLQKFPELKFKYVEEEQPEEFFIPYVWSLVYSSAAGLYWSPQDIQLFTMDSD